jgi:sn-glycerol 3-phosphate transport system substrate-binding protein
MIRPAPTHRRRRTWLAISAVLLLAACATDDTTTDDTTSDDTTSDDTTSDDGTSPTTAPSPSSSPTPRPTDGADATVPDGGTECPVDALAGTGPPIEITLWHSMAATTGVELERLVTDYNASQERVRVTAVFQGGYAETFGKYVNTVRSDGELPTLVQLSEIYLQPMIDSQTIVPVEDCIDSSGYDLSDYSQRLLDQYRVDGRLVTMPFQLANPVLYYDGNDFVAAGLDPADPPTTLDELEATSRALVDAGVVGSGVALEVDAWSFEQWIATAGADLVDHDNGRTGRAERALLDGDVVGGVLDTLQRMHDSGLLLVTGRGGEQAGLARYVAVAQGEAAMTIGSSASLGEIYEQIALVPDVDVRVGPFPGSGGSTTVGGGSIYLTNGAADAERAAAWDLLTWLNEPSQQVRWSIGTGYVPTRSSAADDPELQQFWTERPQFRVAWDQLAVAGDGGAGPVIGDYAAVRDAIEDGLEALYAGDPRTEVQAAMQEAADRAIADYNDRIGG